MAERGEQPEYPALARLAYLVEYIRQSNLALHSTPQLEVIDNSSQSRWVRLHDV